MCHLKRSFYIWSNKLYWKFVSNAGWLGCSINTTLVEVSNEEFAKPWTMRNGAVVYSTMPKPALIPCLFSKQLFQHCGQLKVYLHYRYVNCRKCMVHRPMIAKKYSNLKLKNSNKRFALLWSVFCFTQFNIELVECICIQRITSCFAKLYHWSINFSKLIV